MNQGFTRSGSILSLILVDEQSEMPFEWRYCEAFVSLVVFFFCMDYLDNCVNLHINFGCILKQIV